MVTKGEFDRDKLSRLVFDFREQLGMTQNQFALYYTETTGLPCTYGFVQSLENQSKNSVPSYPNMRGLAEILGVSIGELDAYLHNPEIKTLTDACKRPEFFETMLKGQDRVVSTLKENYSAEERLSIAQALLSDAIEEIQNRLTVFKEKANEKYKTMLSVLTTDLYTSPLIVATWGFLDSKGLTEEWQKFVSRNDVIDPLRKEQQEKFDKSPTFCDGIDL